MKKMIVICIGVIMAGCATTDQLKEANAKIQELEKKVARIEGDLYKVEVKSAPKQAAVPKLVPAKEVEQNVIDAKINAFIKEYLGVQFGDSIDGFPQKMERYGRHMDNLARVIPVLKKFKYFDKAEGMFEDGKLYGVKFYTDIDTKYSVDSTTEKIDQALADMAVTFGLSSTAFERGYGARRFMLSQSQRGSTPEPTSSYRLSKHNGECAPAGFRRRGAVISNSRFAERLREEKRQRERAAGETARREIAYQDDLLNRTVL